MTDGKIYIKVGSPQIKCKSLKYNRCHYEEIIPGPTCFLLKRISKPFPFYCIYLLDSDDFSHFLLYCFILEQFRFIDPKSLVNFSISPATLSSLAFIFIFYNFAHFNNNDLIMFPSNVNIWIILHLLSVFFFL